MSNQKLPLERAPMTMTRQVAEKPIVKRFEFEYNMVGANYMLVNISSWTVQDLGFGSREYIGCKVKMLPGGMRLAVYHNDKWVQIHADIKRS